MFSISFWWQRFFGPSSRQYKENYGIYFFKVNFALCHAFYCEISTNTNATDLNFCRCVEQTLSFEYKMRIWQNLGENAAETLIFFSMWNMGRKEELLFFK